jgi:HAD superfamily hydrolase (TIGR01509 family)
VRAIIFDFDGVIADTEPFHFLTFQQTLAEEGIHVEESRDLERFLGLNDRAAFQKAFREAGRKLGPAACRDLVERKSVYYCRRLPEVRLFPGVKRLLSALDARLPLAIASGGRTGEIELILANHGIRRHFAAVVSADEVPRSKPFPDSYLRALEALEVRGLRPADCLAIEDSLPGIRAARAAGMSCLAVAHTWPLASLAEADRVVEKLAHVTVRDLLGNGNGSGATSSIPRKHPGT